MANSQELDIMKEKNDLDLTGQPDSDPKDSTVDDVPGVYGALKCYFYTPKRGDIWGAFCFLFNGTTGESMENVFWVTRALVGPSIDANMQWKALNKMIPKMGNYEKSLGEKLSVLMLDSFSPGVRVKLCQSVDPSEQLETISSEIRNAFERATHCFLDFKMSFECMTKQELTSAGVLTKENVPAEPRAGKTEVNERSFAGTFINCLPVIDPVHGTPVSELAPDDMVEVKIQGGVGAAELIHKYLASTNQDAVFPVERVERTDTDKTYIFLKINEEAKGIVTVTKDIRLRVLRRGYRKKKSITINLDNVIFIGILIAAIAVIALVVRFLLF